MARKLSIALVAVLALSVVFASAASARKGGRDYYLAYHPPTVAEKPGKVLMIHGGGWKGDLGANADAIMSAYIEDVRSWGYGTYNIGYRSGASSIRDVIDATRRIARKNPDEDLCLIGGSAGAHLALMTAIRLRKEVDCVVDIGGPPDLVNPDGAPHSNVVFQLASAAFGTVDRLLRLSPINRVKEIRQAVLVVAADCDDFTSLERQAAFAQALRRGELYRQFEVVRNPVSSLLSSFGFGFFNNFGFGSQDPGVEAGHCTVTRASFDGFRAAERSFLDRNLAPDLKQRTR